MLDPWEQSYLIWNLTMSPLPKKDLEGPPETRHLVVINITNCYRPQIVSDQSIPHIGGFLVDV